MVLCVGVVTTLAGGGSAGSVTSGYLDGTGSEAKFHDPIGIAINSQGLIYVADSGNNMIRIISSTG